MRIETKVTYWKQKLFDGFIVTVIFLTGFAWGLWYNSKKIQDLKISGINFIGRLGMCEKFLSPAQLKILDDADKEKVNHEDPTF